MSYNFRILVTTTAGVRFELERTYPFPDTIRAARTALSVYAEVPASALPARQSYSDGLAFWEDGPVRWTAAATRVEAPADAEVVDDEPEPWELPATSPRPTTEAERFDAHRATLTASRTEGASFTAPNAYGHPVRFWARDEEHAAFIARRANLRADGIVRLAARPTTEAERDRVLAANRRLNESVRHLSARVEAASRLADAASAAMLALDVARHLTGNTGADRPRDVADELGEAIVAYRSAGASPTGRTRTAPPLRA